ANSSGVVSGSGGSCGGTPAGSTGAIQYNTGSAFGGAVVSGLVKGNGTSAPSAATSGTDYAPATSGSAILKGNGSGGFSSAASGTDYAPATSGSAILKGNGSGGFSSAASGTDYAPATSGSSILKGNGSGGFSNAASGTDYAPATSGSAILKGNGSGGFSNAASGTDYAPATSGSAILKGNGSGGFSSAASGTDYAPATSGSAILKGNGSGGFSSAVSGTDYAAAPLMAVLSSDAPGFTSNTTLGTVGLSASLVAGKTYVCDATLLVSSSSGGAQAELATSDTLTTTAIGYVVNLFVNTASSSKFSTVQSALASAVGVTAQVNSIEIHAGIVVNAAGTLQVEAAQNSSNAATTTIKAGSQLKCQPTS